MHIHIHGSLFLRGEAGGFVGPAWLIEQGLSKPDYAISAGFSYALEGYGLRLAAGRTPFETITAVTVLSSLMGLPWLIIGDVSWIAEPSGFAAVMTLALVSSVFPYCFFASGLKRITMGKAYTLSLSEPMTAWILSSLLLGERLSFVGIAGVLILFSGIILLACDQNK